MTHDIDYLRLAANLWRKSFAEGYYSAGRSSGIASWAQQCRAIRQSAAGLSATTVAGPGGAADRMGKMTVSVRN
jgi:hypothetical protein